MREVIIASAVRTPVGSFLGAFSDVSAVELATIVIKEALKRAKNIKPEDIDEVILGSVLQTGKYQGIVRQAAVHAGIPIEKPAFSINILCGSGLRSVSMAAQMIKAGDADIVICGGTENMSQAPYILNELRTGKKMGDVTLVDSMIVDGLTDGFNKYHMGITAENIAEKYGITREMQDKFALRSQHNAEKAQKEGKFIDEIIPVVVKTRKGDIIVSEDEFPKHGSTLDKLSSLKPAFKKDGTVTAGNASGVNDGAAALVIMSKEKADELGIVPMATIKGYATTGVDPAIMGVGPIEASKKALKQAGITVNDLDLIESNEAFAAQSIAVANELGFDLEKVNVNGGAIALGHPIGASGARILTTLLYEMKKRNSKHGLATLCVGGGMGVALVVEM